jgi:Helix-turn-helix domain
MSAVKVRRFALARSPAQERALRSHAGAARFAWNWGLARCTERHAIERKWYSAAELHRLWNAQKKADAALGWWAENLAGRVPVNQEHGTAHAGKTGTVPRQRGTAA